MAVELVRYVCNICGSEYDNFQEASICELRGEPDTWNEVALGEVLSFDTESQMFGRWSYSCDSQAVVAKLAYLTVNDVHSSYCVVEAPFGYRIVYGSKEHGFISRAEDSYTPELINMLRERREQGRHLIEIA